MIPRLALRFVVVFFCVWVSTAAAQETTGTILGTVTDASGGVLPSVTISVKHLETSQVRSVATDSGGRYRVQALLVGSYEITAQLPGFLNLVRSGIVLTVAMEAVVNITMTIGDVCLVKSPFSLRQLMLQPTMDTLLGDDLGALLAPPDPPHIGAFARHASARSPGSAAPTAGAATHSASAGAAREDRPLALGRALPHLLILNRSRKRSPNLRRRRHETAEPDLGMPTDRATDHPGLRYSHQQGCGATHSRCSVPAETRLSGAVLAHGPGHAKDSLWSLDLFRCESAVLHTHWVLVVMDPWTRRIVGFGVHRGVVEGVALCQMFNRATRRQPPPTYLSSDHDPLYRFHQWQANLRILDVKAVKTVPSAPLSHPFVERLIGTIRRECLDRTLFWTAADLEVKLLDFQRYFNSHRTHSGIGGLTREPRTGDDSARASVSRYRWRLHCRGLYQTPIAA